MKKILITLVAVLAWLPLDSFGAVRWSLDSCVNYALLHNVEVRQRINAMRQGELAVKEAKDRVLPNVSGYGSQNFSFGRGLTADNTYANRNTSSFSVGAQLSVPLFQG
ncbi:MAG: TolC family protein, partial [Muribaculaceae bacterium]|nr:TolC family protein [Muribaculaceae bacterium]